MARARGENGQGLLTSVDSARRGLATVDLHHGASTQPLASNEG